MWEQKMGDFTAAWQLVNIYMNRRFKFNALVFVNSICKEKEDTKNRPREFCL